MDQLVLTYMTVSYLFIYICIYLVYFYLVYYYDPNVFSCLFISFRFFIEKWCIVCKKNQRFDFIYQQQDYSIPQQ